MGFAQMAAVQTGVVSGAVRVPAPVVELNETHAAFAEATREQAIVREAILAGLGAVPFVRRLGFAGNIGRLGDAHLHAERQFILAHPRKRLGIAKLGDGLLVDFVDGVQGGTPLLARDSIRVAREQNWLTVTVALHALIDAGKKSVAPNCFACVRSFAAAG